ncbi:MAG: hypothetical protein ACKVQC_08880 [Elusimicrobiota bacterium]
MENFIQKLGMIGAIAMPFWNIPFMVRIIKRKTSEDISLFWLFGIWGCIVAMFPSTMNSPDPILKAFGITNMIMFSLVVVVVMLYRKKK